MFGCVVSGHGSGEFERGGCSHISTERSPLVLELAGRDAVVLARGDLLFAC